MQESNADQLTRVSPRIHSHGISTLLRRNFSQTNMRVLARGGRGGWGAEKVKASNAGLRRRRRPIKSYARNLPETLHPCLIAQILFGKSRASSFASKLKGGKNPPPSGSRSHAVPPSCRAVETP